MSLVVRFAIAAKQFFALFNITQSVKRHAMFVNPHIGIRATTMINITHYTRRISRYNPFCFVKRLQNLKALDL